MALNWIQYQVYGRVKNGFHGLKIEKGWGILECKLSLVILLRK